MEQTFGDPVPTSAVLFSWGQIDQNEDPRGKLMVLEEAMVARSRNIEVSKFRETYTSH